MKKFALHTTTVAVFLASNAVIASPFIDDAKFNADLRLRYENVDMDNTKIDADAVTARARLGVTSGVFNGLSAGVEGEATAEINDKFNSTRNGQGDYNTVVDPESYELNKLWLKYQFPVDGFLKGSDITIGRQAINLDNQRFVGGVAWRQNEQTYDAASLNLKFTPNFALYYAYIDQVNTIFGSEDATPIANNAAQPSEVDSESHLVQLRYIAGEAFNAVAYGYLLDLQDWSADTLSSQTIGARIHGKIPSLPLRYVAEYATQQDYADNQIDYEADYYNVELAYLLPASVVKGEIATGYEVLGSDEGVRGFQTPLGTKHKFNGWNDLFLNTPADGLADSYLSFKVNPIEKVSLGGEYHYYTTDENSRYLGQEYGLVLSSALPLKGTSVLTKWSNFESEDASLVDTRKVWVQMEYKY